MNRFFLLLFTLLLLLASLGAWAQNEIKLIKGEKLKKENDLYGIMYEKEWTVPPQYEKLEAYAWNYLFAYKGNEVDVYRNWSKKELLQKSLPVKYVDLYKSFANTGNEPVYAQGKWGFTNQFYKTEPKYDSIYVMCMENSKSCGDYIGVVLDEKKGVVGKNGEEVVMHPDYVKYMARFINNGSNSRFEIEATHKKGYKIVYDPYSRTNNEFVEFTDNNNLKGYVYKGTLVEPAYTAIKICLLKIADYECTLPDGTIEYRKGTEVVKQGDIADAQAKKEKEEQQYKEQQEAAKKINSLLSSLSKEDSMEAMNYFRKDIVIYQKNFKFGLKRNDGSYDGTILTHAVFNKITFEKSPKPEMQSKSNKFMYHLVGDYMNIYYQIPSFYLEENPDYLVGYAESSATCSKCKGTGEVTETTEETAKEWVPPTTTTSSTTTNEVHYNTSSGKHENYSITRTGTSTIVPGYYETVVTKTDTKTVSCDACNKGVVEITHNAYFDPALNRYFEKVSPAKYK